MTVTSFDEEQAAASVPVASMIVGEEATRAFRGRMVLRAYLTRAESPTGMQLTRAFTATIKGFNQAYGAQCRTWAQVAQCAHYLLSREV